MKICYFQKAWRDMNGKPVVIAGGDIVDESMCDPYWEDHLPVGFKVDSDLVVFTSKPIKQQILPGADRHYLNRSRKQERSS